VDYEEESSNSFVIELYQGIQAALATLADQGIDIQLFAYDTKKDPVTTAALLAQEEVKGMDLIIGPLYATTIPLVAEFARVHQINLFNPLSENTDVVGDNPFVFLFKSSLETQARKAAEFTLQNANEELNVGIVYGTSKADAVQAHTYKRCIEHNTGKEVGLMLSITPEEAQNALNMLTEAREGIGEEKATAYNELISLDGLTHIYVAAKDELIVANILSRAAMLKDPPCIIGHESWLHHSSFTFDQLKQHRLYLVAPDYIDYTKADIHEFRSNFYDRFAQYPTTYACIGYEMMLFLGHMLAQYGVYFQKHWTQESHPRSILEHAAYGMYHDNQQVPIVQFRKDRFVICNQRMPRD
jgi:Periplasmic binding protein